MKVTSYLAHAAVRLPDPTSSNGYVLGLFVARFDAQNAADEFRHAPVVVVDLPKPIAITVDVPDEYPPRSPHA